MRPFSKSKKGNNHDINEVQIPTPKPIRTVSQKNVVWSHRTKAGMTPRAVRRKPSKNEKNSAKKKLENSVKSVQPLNSTWVGTPFRTPFPNNRRSNPNNNTLVQNPGTFNVSTQLENVGFSLQPGGKSTTVLGGVTKQNKKANNLITKANNLIKKANSNSNKTTSFRNTMRMITLKRMLLTMCYLAQDTQNLSKDLRKACHRISPRKFLSRARPNNRSYQLSR